MAQQHAPESEETGIDLAPMLDFVMNLLIFFIITTSFVKEAGITVDKGLAVSITGLYPVYYFNHRTRRETELLADQFEF